MGSFAYERVKELNKLVYEWVLRQEMEETVERYCAHCGRKAVFQDSRQRRVNANGKDLYEFAIFKCERDHTWNKPLGRYKAGDFARSDEKTGAMPASQMERIDPQLCIQRNVQVIEIILREVAGKWRLDKLLAQQIEGWSRTRVGRLIEIGAISVVGRQTGETAFVKAGDTIRITIPNP